MHAAAWGDPASGRICGEGETASSGGTADWGSLSGFGSVLLSEDGEETGGGHIAPP